MLALNEKIRFAAKGSTSNSIWQNTGIIDISDIEVGDVLALGLFTDLDLDLLKIRNIQFHPTVANSVPAATGIGLWLIGIFFLLNHRQKVLKNFKYHRD
jgi:hypothetical protein